MSTRSTSILCVAFTSALLTGAPGVAFASLHAPRIAVSSTNSDWEHVGGLFQVTAIDHDGPHIVNPLLSVPEPTTALLPAVGLTLLAASRREISRV